MLSRALLAVCLFNLVVSLSQNVVIRHKYASCPKDWFRFEDSCYYFETKKMHFDKAEVSCLERGSTMFVADSPREWVEVLSHSPLHFWSWIGLHRDEDEPEPSWKEKGGMAMDQINWLNRARTPQRNGWSPVARCVAHFSSPTVRYAYFYYCGMKYYSICERNGTLLSQIWDDSWERF